MGSKITLGSLTLCIDKNSWKILKNFIQKKKSNSLQKMDHFAELSLDQYLNIFTKSNDST